VAEAAPRRRSWWWRFRQDLGRRIEHRGLVLWYLVVERGLKGVALLLIGFFVATHVQTGLDGAAAALIDQLNLDSGSNFLSQGAYRLVLKFVGVSQGSLVALSVGSLLYGVIEAAESIGLLLKRRWAEYLVVLATAFFIPVEIVELVRHPTVLKAAAFLVNVIVVAYLVRRKRLFHLDETRGEA
jgi:uncharacterized membrane protein (DUF2068 family)